jgi:hypothetical protein
MEHILYIYIYIYILRPHLLSLQCAAQSLHTPGQARDPLPQPLDMLPTDPLLLHNLLLLLLLWLWLLFGSCFGLAPGGDTALLATAAHTQLSYQNQD